MSQGETVRGCNGLKVSICFSKFEITCLERLLRVQTNASRFKKKKISRMAGEENCYSKVRLSYQISATIFGIYFAFVFCFFVDALDSV